MTQIHWARSCCHWLQCCWGTFYLDIKSSLFSHYSRRNRTPPIWPASCSRDNTHHHVFIQITNARVEFLRPVWQSIEVTNIGTRFCFFCCTVSCQAYLTNCQTSPMKEAWSLKSVWSRMRPGTQGPSSDRDLWEVNAFRRCWDINWEVFMRGQWGKLSEIISGYRRGTRALQLTSRSSSSEGDRRDSWILPASSACEEAGGWVSSSLCHKIFGFKIFPLLQRGGFTEAPRSPDRQDSTGKPIAPVRGWRHVKWSWNNQLCDWHWQIRHKWVRYWLYQNQGRPSRTVICYQYTKISYIYTLTWVFFFFFLK